jgi:hypothetical protein
MLKSVVSPEVASLSIGIYLLSVSVDYTVSIQLFQYVVSSFNFTTTCAQELCHGSYGILMFYFNAVPSALAIPLFYFAGLSYKKTQENKIENGEMT